MMTGPMFAGLLLLMGIAPLSAWGRSTVKTLGRAIWKPLAFSLLVAAGLVIGGLRQPAAILGFWLVALVGSVTLYEFWRGSMARHNAHGESMPVALWHLAGKNRRRYGGYIIHLGVILMALGFASAGKRAAVGTSGGGFCLMTEGLSLAGMAEIPIVLLVSQRTGPSTGLPTYTGQSDLMFVQHAGQGEFPRLIVAPGTAEEALYWSEAAMHLAWEFQIPAFILSDKTLSEGTYSTDLSAVPEMPRGIPPSWDRAVPYRRYADIPSGISPSR